MKKTSKKVVKKNEEVISISTKTGLVGLVISFVTALYAGYVCSDVLECIGIIPSEAFYHVWGMLIPFLFIFIGLAILLFIGVSVYSKAMNK